MATVNIKCNFASVFAQFETIEEITSVANNICAQVKEAFDARKEELTAKEVAVEVFVEAATEEVEETKSEPKKEAKKSSSKTSKAKEMAAKMKAEKESKVESKKETKKTEPKEQVRKEQKEDSGTLIAVTDTAAIKKLGLTFQKYNDKCYVLRGDTKPLRKVLKEDFKGVFNSRLSGGEGWVISAKHAQNCAKALGLKYSA